MPKNVIVLDRIAFCSQECVDAALEDYDPGLIVMRSVGDIVARTIRCYCCGLHLDEVERKGAGAK